MVPRHVILFSIDDLRFDAVGWQPDRRYWHALGIQPTVRTPTMDALARECVLFTRCISNAGYTALSHATLFTGCHARRHGVVNFHTTRCRPDVSTLGEAFARGGWRTMLLTNAPRQTLFCDANQSLRGIQQRFSDDREFLAALRGAAHEPVFAVIHVCDVHDPLVRGGEPTGPNANATNAAIERNWELFLRLVFNARPVPEADSSDVILHDGTRISYYDLQSRAAGKSADEQLAHLRRLYQAYLYTCEQFDAQRFKRLIDGLRAAGAWEQTALALLSDHGESQHWANPWRLAHGPLTDETVTRVPLMLKIPGVPPHRIEHLTGLVDVAPTLLELARIKSDSASLDGRSLLPTVRENRPAGEEYWIEGWSHELSDDDPHVICRAIRRADGRKYVWNGAAIDWAGLDALSEVQFAEYAARCSFGNPPSPWLRAQIARLRQEQSRAAVLRSLLAGCRPRHVIFDDVDSDLTERAGVVVDETHPRWNEYEQYRQKMLEWTAVPNGVETPATPAASACVAHADIRPLAEADAKALTAHLQALGYV